MSLRTKNSNLLKGHNENYQKINWNNFLKVLKNVITCIRKVSTTSKDKVLHIKAVFNPGNTSSIP